MPTKAQYEIVEQQVNSFESIGCVTTFEMQGFLNDAAPQIVIFAPNKKIYKFSDPDWDVVSKQLAILYMKIRGKRC